MDVLDLALERRKVRMNEAAPLAVIGKAALVAGKAIAKGAAVAAKTGAKAAAKGGKLAVKGGAKGAKGAKGATKVINPTVVGGEAKKSAQIAKNVKPKSGPTIDVKATEVSDTKKATMSSKSSTPKTKYGKSKGGEMQKSQSSDITNKGKNQVDPKKNPEADKPKDEPKKEEEPKKDNKNNNKKKKGEKPDVAGAISRAYGKTSFSVKEQKTFRDFLTLLQ
tara:strand:+ start:6156 stop:6818 length:663 start_codon:yes stop_codon:yes gene_type:complete